MATISKDDKRIWENYVSNLENYILFPKNDGLSKNKIVNSNHVVRKKSSNSVRSLKKKKLELDAILDLHGQTLYSAKLLLHKFMSYCYEKNIRNILIITGKGQNNKGVLKEEVPKWLNDNLLNKFLVNFNVAPKHFGGEGALLVRLKNRFKTNYQ
jgi:DNA-nicking Smr family endonuclease